jgi:hypothetical protein
MIRLGEDRACIFSLSQSFCPSVPRPKDCPFILASLYLSRYNPPLASGRRADFYRFKIDQYDQIELNIEHRTLIMDPRIDAKSGKVEGIVEVGV